MLRGAAIAGELAAIFEQFDVLHITDVVLEVVALAYPISQNTLFLFTLLICNQKVNKIYLKNSKQIYPTSPHPKPKRKSQNI